MKGVYLLGLALCSYFHQIESFQIIDSGFSPSNPKSGDSLKLLCKADAAFEYCIWRHIDKVCQFEWVYKHGRVMKQTCSELHPRVDFIGDYQNNECLIELRDYRMEDMGVWRCEVEKYVWGPARGTVDNRIVILPEPYQEQTTGPTITSTQGGIVTSDEFETGSTLDGEKEPDIHVTSPPTSTDISEPTEQLGPFFTKTESTDVITQSADEIETDPQESRTFSPGTENDQEPRSGKSIDDKEDKNGVNVEDDDMTWVAILVACFIVAFIGIILGLVLYNHRRKRGMVDLEEDEKDVAELNNIMEEQPYEEEKEGNSQRLTYKGCREYFKEFE